MHLFIHFHRGPSPRTTIWCASRTSPSSAKGASRSGADGFLVITRLTCLVSIIDPSCCMDSPTRSQTHHITNAQQVGSRAALHPLALPRVALQRPAPPPWVPEPAADGGAAGGPEGGHLPLPLQHEPPRPPLHLLCRQAQPPAAAAGAATATAPACGGRRVGHHPDPPLFGAGGGGRAVRRLHGAGPVAAQLPARLGHVLGEFAGGLPRSAQGAGPGAAQAV